MTDTATAGFADFPGAAWLTNLRERGSAAAFAEARSALDGRVEGYHTELPDIPDRQAGYYHDFFCPTHAVQLVFNPRNGHHHVCPVDGATFSGEPFDSAWGWSVNDALSDAALRAAVRRVLGHADGRRDADAGLVRGVLLGCAERYRGMPQAPKRYPNRYRGIACWSALDESVWIIRLAWAAALARDAFGAAEIRRLREGLFEPALRHLLRVRYRHIQNVGNWDRGAILTLGLLLDDQAAVGEAIDGTYGIRDQLTRGVTDDGLWWELSMSYHFYVLGAVAWTMRALRASGRTFDPEDVVRRMFQAPLDLAFPDLTLPATNDSWYHIGLTGEVGHGIPNADGFYEMAFGWFGDPAFAWVVGENRRAGRPRATLEALLDGALDIPAVKRPEGRPRWFAASGLAALRSGSGHGADATMALLKAAGDGDAHGHPDQLGIAIFAAASRIAIDPGTPGYGVSLNDTWYRQTAAHSTVLLDARSQPPGQGRITAFETVDGVTTVDAEVTWPSLRRWPRLVLHATSIGWPDPMPSRSYAGVRFRRTVAVGDASVTDTFRAEAPSVRTIDYVLHLGAEAEPGGRTSPTTAVAGRCGYDDLRDARALEADGTVRIDSAGVVVSFDRDPGEEVFLATAPGNPATDVHHVLIRRRRAAAATFVTTLDLRR